MVEGSQRIGGGISGLQPETADVAVPHDNTPAGKAFLHSVSKLQEPTITLQKSLLPKPSLENENLSRFSISVVPEPVKQLPSPSGKAATSQQPPTEARATEALASTLASETLAKPASVHSGVDRQTIDQKNNPFLKDRSLKSTKPKPSNAPRKFSLKDTALQITKQSQVSRALGSQGDQFSKDCLMGLDAVAEFENQGIPRDYLEKMQDVAEKDGVIIGIRPVERICRTLIEESYASKPLTIKAKSANWGPQAGFLPVNQAFSKKAGLTDEIAKYNNYAQKCIEKGDAIAQQLSLSTARIDELKELGVLKNADDTAPLEGYTRAEVFSSTLEADGRRVTQSFEAHQRNDGQWDIFIAGSEGLEKLEVLADKEGGPMTADFDLLFVDAHYENVDLGQQDRRHGFDAKLGIYSKRMAQVGEDINNALNRGAGRDMVHHGADTSNPATEMEANLPATILLPAKQIGMYKSPLLLKSLPELKRFLTTMQAMGYKTDINPLWSGLKEVTSAPIQEKIEYFEKKGIIRP